MIFCPRIFFFSWLAGKLAVEAVALSLFMLWEGEMNDSVREGEREEKRKWKEEKDLSQLVQVCVQYISTVLLELVVG